MKFRHTFIAALMITIINAAIYFAPDAFSRTQCTVGNKRNVLILTDTAGRVNLDTFYLGSTGYYVLVPDGYYMSNEPYPGYITKVGDTSNLYFCFFPFEKDSICRTRLLINFSKENLPKTGYSRGSEFYIKDTILNKEINFLDHSSCVYPYRHRSGSILMDDKSYIHILCEAGKPEVMQQLFAVGLSISKR